MRVSNVLSLSLAIFASVSMIANAHAQPAASPPAEAPSGDTLKVATRVLPPMVTQENGELGGFSIELWREIAARLGVKTVLKVEPDVRTLLASVKGGGADVGIAAISITAEREREFDFSQPMLDSGLQILVSGAGLSTSKNPLPELLRVIFSRDILYWLGIAFLLLAIPAHILWYVERDHADGIIPTRDYIPGIFHAMWWAGSCLATQAGEMPRHWLSRILALLWMFFAIVFVAYYTAQLTAELTVERIQGEISGPQDLPGKVVAATKGSTAAAYLEEITAKVEEVPNIAEAYEALDRGKVAAVVFDAPILRHYAAHAGKGRVQVVGPVFREEDYGIAFPQGSPWRKRVNAALLSMREDGSFQKLYEKFFAGP
jgi:polar amino acid transport system substrate-binding protein